MFKLNMSLVEIGGALLGLLLIEAAINQTSQSKCSGDIVTRLHCLSVEATRVEWKPVSVFPEETNPLRGRHKSKFGR